jgi:hypothetical protein
MKAGRVWQSAAVLSRYLEYLNKLEYHLSFFKTYAQSLEATRHLDLPWPDTKPEVWSESARMMRDRIGPKMADYILLRSLSQKPEGIPDYLGQFIHETGENLFNSLLARRSEEAHALITHYLAGSLFLFEQMKPLTPKVDVWTEQKLQIAAAPVLDLLELSEHGKLLAGLHAGRLTMSPNIISSTVI